MTSRVPFFGWRVVWAAFVLAIFGWGVGFYGPPVYLHAVVERTGWPVSMVSIAVTVHFLIGAVVVANLPALYRRFGVAAVTGAGAAALGCGVLGWALASEPWQLFAAALLSGSGWVAMGAAALNAIVAPWFVRSRPAALATAYNGASVGGVIFSPLWVALIGRLQFPAAAAAIGGVMVITTWTLSYVVFSTTPERVGQSPDGEAPRAEPGRAPASGARRLPGSALWADRSFLTLAAAMALGLFAQIGLLAHLFSLLVPVLGAQAAGLAMGTATLCAIAGRTLVGWLMPARADRRAVACGGYLVQAAGSAILALSGGQSIPLLLLGVVLFGSGIGNATSLPPMIAQSEFAGEDVQRVVSLIVAFGQGTYAFAPALFGVLRSIAPGGPGRPPGSATVMFVVAGMIQLAAIACFLAGRRRPTREAVSLALEG
jgi:MFS family permease